MYLVLIPHCMTELAKSAKVENLLVLVLGTLKVLVGIVMMVHCK